MFIAVNKVPVQNAEQRQAMEKAFEHAMPGMKQFKGFLGLELWHQEDGELLAVSRWESREALQEYTSNELFRHHHGDTSDAQADHHGHAGASGEHPGHHGGAGSGQSGHPGVTTYYDAKILG